MRKDKTFNFTVELIQSMMWTDEFNVSYLVDKQTCSINYCIYTLEFCSILYHECNILWQNNILTIKIGFNFLNFLFCFFNGVGSHLILIQGGSRSTERKIRIWIQRVEKIQIQGAEINRYGSRKREKTQIWVQGEKKYHVTWSRESESRERKTTQGAGKNTNLDPGREKNTLPESRNRKNTGLFQGSGKKIHQNAWVGKGRNRSRILNLDIKKWF